mgnify:CR=1 FL=1
MSKKKTTEEFISDAKKVHGDKYDYSRVKYINYHDKVEIICKKDGNVFWQNAATHLNGSGCSKCCLNRRKTNEEFISDAIKVHGDKYDYSKIKYVKGHGDIEIICKMCDNVFWQRATHHLQGRGCPKCGMRKIGETHRHDAQIFINKAKKIHGDKYDYSKVKYNGYDNKVEIICKKDGIFWQRAGHHLDGKGCSKCANRNRCITFDEFLVKSKKIHKESYKYLGFDGEFRNITDTKVNIFCKKCNSNFKQTANDHLSGRGCPTCRNSKGEKLIKSWLDNKNMKYECQKTFNDCKNPKTNKLLKYDFYMPEKNLLIEFDGLQHFKVKNSGYFTKDNLKEIKYRDGIKNKYAKKAKIELLRIPYTKINEIDSILSNKILNKDYKYPNSKWFEYK